MKDGRRFGRPPNRYQPPERPTGKVNVTDPDSQLVKTMRGWIQGYNAQAVTNEQQIVIAAEVTIDSPDFGHLEPMVDATQGALAKAGVSEAPEVVLADAGYWHRPQMENVASRGIRVLVPPYSSRRKGSRPGWEGGAYAFMRRVLASDAGGALYAKRQSMIEPVFGDTKFQPPARSLLTPRQSRLPVQMAPHQRDRQLTQASPPTDSRQGGLKTPPPRRFDTNAHEALPRRARPARRHAPLRNSLA